MWSPLFNVFVPKVKLGVIADEMSQALTRELDYEQEARFTQTIHENLVGIPGVTIPRVLPEHTTRNVICTTWFDGHKITDRAMVDELGVDIHELMRRIIHAFTHMVFVDGVFQSDPHPGNILFNRREGAAEVCVLDFGQVKELPPEFQAKMLKASMAYMVRDVEGFTRSVVDLGVMNEKDVETAKPLIVEFFDNYFEMSPAEARQLDFEKIKDDVPRRGLTHRKRHHPAGHHPLRSHVRPPCRGVHGAGFGDQRAHAREADHHGDADEVAGNGADDRRKRAGSGMTD